MGVCKCRKLQPLLGINYLQSYQLKELLGRKQYAQKSKEANDNQLSIQLYSPLECFLIILRSVK